MYFQFLQSVNEFCKMNGVLGCDVALVRLYPAGDNLG